LQKDPRPPRPSYAFLEQKDPEQVWREAHELFHSNLELIDELAYIKMPEQAAAEKAKEADAFTCRGCTVKYTDATSSGAKTKKNYGYCSKTCRDGKGRCKHGRYRSKCKDCGTGQCQHKLWKTNCKDCGNRQQPIGNRQQPIANRQ
jgi:hypothetical protein